MAMGDWSLGGDADDVSFRRLAGTSSEHDGQLGIPGSADPGLIKVRVGEQCLATMDGLARSRSVNCDGVLTCASWTDAGLAIILVP